MSNAMAYQGAAARPRGSIADIDRIGVSRSGEDGYISSVEVDEVSVRAGHHRVIPHTMGIMADRARRVDSRPCRIADDMPAMASSACEVLPEAVVVQDAAAVMASVAERIGVRAFDRVVRGDVLLPDQRAIE